MSNFDKAFDALIGHEGGYSNHPADPGGETMYGITKRVAVANGYTGPMRDLPLSKAKEIAKRAYWDVVRCDELPYAIAFQMFDTVFNGGKPVLWLQGALNVTVDGVLGAQTINAARNADVSRTVLRFCAYRLQYYTSLGTFSTFGKGWTRRVAENMLNV